MELLVTTPASAETLIVAGYPFQGIPLSDGARLELEQSPRLVHAINRALAELTKYVLSEFKVELDRFVDPYDGCPSIFVSIISSAAYAEVSAGIDRFCDQYWYQFMDEMPLSVVFQAGV